jgi:hypothetical protein
MKILFLLFFFSVPTYALRVEFIGPCDSRPFLSRDYTSSPNDTIGDVTINLLQNAGIPFLGDSKGINQIYNSPIGLDAMEVISNNEMLAYGWCYELDGKILESYPDEVKVGHGKKLKWFYGYAHYLDGIWIAQCLASHLRRSLFMCQRN